MYTSDEKKILDICDKGSEDFLKLDNVNALGLGYKYTKSKSTGELCLQVLVQKKLDKAIIGNKNIIPKSYMNIKTDVIEIGEVFAQSLRERVRPLKCGYSVGPKGFHWSGTAGCIVKRGGGFNTEYFILSNNHVLAGSNAVALGTDILQPSVGDGGNSNDAIAKLSEFVPIKFESPNNKPINFLDCALAKVNNHDIISPEIAWCGFINGVDDPVLNGQVKKSGRTTGRVDGKVRSLGVTVRVNYGSNKFAIFKNQILLDPISKAGDSGSVVLNENNKAIGLLFAGSPSVTICNNFKTVLSILDVELIV